MNPFKKLKSAFNRAKVNHPVKTYTTGATVFGSGLTTAAFLLAPLDFGALSGSIALTGILITAIHNAENNSKRSHYRTETIGHNDESFIVTRAQAYKYGQLSEKISRLKKAYDATGSAKERARLTKKAQRLVNFQDDILDSKNIRSPGDNTPRPAMELTYRNRRPGN